MTDDLLEILKYIDPCKLDYTEWINVGMALKQEGYTAFDWEQWSSSDPRHKDGECYSKWNSFEGSGITGGTLVHLAQKNGYLSSDYGVGRSLEWDDTINDDYVVIDKEWVEPQGFSEPTHWNPKEELITYLTTLFDTDENVGYLTESYKNEKGKFIPKNKGYWDRTAGQLIELLTKANQIEEVIGDYDHDGGAWIRFNPLDGQGVKNSNVTEFRYALVESDTMDLAKQNALIRELELPVAALVYSGSKSIHAIVHIDATNYVEYKKRVEFLYEVCNKNGLTLDTQNKNPSRLSRMPGVVRGSHKQFIIDTNIGKSNWKEWVEWIEAINDDLPQEESLSDVWENMPQLAEPLIEGVLRKGHKMLIAGPSKAGKSFALIEMCIAIAEGTYWLNWKCAQGKVLYVNLELDRASCLHRFKDVYTSMKIKPSNLANIDIWNLRGKSIPMDKLAPKLIRRAAKKDYIAVVIDPIYKVITGDENSADQMANFCNQFDKVCNELNVSVIYCHHHSKGAQGGKRSMDRASGSGVFARDPDALIDLIELNIDDSIKQKISNSSLINIYRHYIDGYGHSEEYTADDLQSPLMMQEVAQGCLSEAQFLQCEHEVSLKISQLNSSSAWRMEGTLREFPKFEPINFWFNYPTHVLDSTGLLKDVDPDMPTYPGYQAKQKKEKPTRLSKFEKAFNDIEMEGKEVTAKELAERMEVSARTLTKWLSPGYEREDKELSSKFEKYTTEVGGQVLIRRVEK